MLLEDERKRKEDELNTINGELRQSNVVLQEKLAKEESDKLVCSMNSIASYIACRNN